MTLQFGLKELNIGLDNWFVLHCPSDRSLTFSVEFTVYLPFLFSTSPACAKHPSLSWWLGYCRLLSVKIQFNNDFVYWEAKDESRGESVLFGCTVPQRVRDHNPHIGFYIIDRQQWLYNEEFDNWSSNICFGHKLETKRNVIIITRVSLSNFVDSNLTILLVVSFPALNQWHNQQHN